MQPLSAHSHLVCGGFQAAVAELSGHDREYVLHKTKTIYCLAPYIKSLLTAAATAKSLQLCLTLCDPIDGNPPGSPIPGILQARTLEWVAISFSNAWKWKVKVKSLSCARLSVTPWTAAYQAPPSMGFSRQEYCSGVPLPSPIAHVRYTVIHTEKTAYVPRIKLLDIGKCCSEIHRCSLFQRWLESFQTSLFLSQPKLNGSSLQIWLTKPIYPNISSSFSHSMFWHTLITNLQTWYAS